MSDEFPPPGDAWPPEQSPPQQPPPAPQTPQVPQQPAQPYQPPAQPYQPPAQPHQQPGFGIPGMETPKKKSRWWLWLLVGFGVLVLLVGGCTALLWSATRGPIDTSNEFIGFIDEKNYVAAWDITNPECFLDGSPAALEDFFGGTDITGYNLSSSSFSSNNGRTTGESSGTITFDGNDERSVRFDLTESGDDWLICGIDVSPAGG
jgi:hypothetical protein